MAKCCLLSLYGEEKEKERKLSGVCAPSFIDERLSSTSPPLISPRRWSFLGLRNCGDPYKKASARNNEGQKIVSYVCSPVKYTRLCPIFSALVTAAHRALTIILITLMILGSFNRGPTPVHPLLKRNFGSHLSRHQHPCHHLRSYCLWFNDD
jgi:hypothetical protein